MAKTTETDLPTKKQFEAFERVRKEGSHNMFDSRAIDASGLSRDVFMKVLKNYTALMEKYPEVRKGSK